MATRPDMHIGDYGTIIDMEIINRQTKQPLDLQTVTNMYFLFEPPTGTPFQKTATVANAPGTDGVIRYVIVDGDIGVAGRWQIQGKVEDPTTPGLWHTDIMEFFVAANIIIP